LEVIQGEGGVNVHTTDYVAQVRQLCDRQGITLIFDEVWTGCGRTGRWFAYQHLQGTDGKSIEPDIMTLGKAAGGGIPVGVMYAKPDLARLFVPGKHGCTLGGNPMCMSVTRTLFDVIQREKLTEHATAMGQYAIKRIKSEPSIQAKIADVRGKGLFLGIELKEAPQKFVERALANGILVNLTAQKVIRLAPPINISQEDIDKGLDLLIATIAAS
jgi:acetylornithine/succinyldiaminopimelate/putrescine aminotransferase